MSEHDPVVATGSQTVGPFFHFAMTQVCRNRLVDGLPAGRERITLQIVVSDGDGLAVADAMVELSQEGVFGRMPTDANGMCEFETVRPQAANRQAGHINVYLFARGLLRHVHTRVYFSGDPALADDRVLALVPDWRHQTLLAVPDGAHRWRFNIRLQGAGETVFFDA